MENLNRVLLENVLPAHVAEHFLGRNWKNEVNSREMSHYIYVELLYLSFVFYSHLYFKEQFDILTICKKVCE